MKLKVGDKVKIRSWKSMENEFGTDHDGDIYMADDHGIFDYFLRDEKRLCGQIVTIKRLCGDCVFNTGTNYLPIEAIDKTYRYGGDSVGI